MRSRRILGLVGAAGLLAGGLVATTGSPALANCSHAHSFKDGTGGYITGTDAALRSGPHHTGTVCSVVGRAYYGQAAQYYCFTTNGSNYNGWTTWTWVYVPAINKQGWVNDYLLSGHGSNVLC